MQCSRGTCSLCCSLSPPQTVCTTCTRQEVLQEQGVLANVRLHELLPLRAFRELICRNDSCSLWFGSSGDAGRKIAHL